MIKRGTTVEPFYNNSKGIEYEHEHIHTSYVSRTTIFDKEWNVCQLNSSHFSNFALNIDIDTGTDTHSHTLSHTLTHHCPH